jgi:hypothetical protein
LCSQLAALGVAVLVLDNRPLGSVDHRRYEAVPGHGELVPIASDRCEFASGAPNPREYDRAISQVLVVVVSDPHSDEDIIGK